MAENNSPEYKCEGKCNKRMQRARCNARGVGVTGITATDVAVVVLEQRTYCRRLGKRLVQQTPKNGYTRQNNGVAAAFTQTPRRENLNETKRKRKTPVNGTQNSGARPCARNAEKAWQSCLARSVRSGRPGMSEP